MALQFDGVGTLPTSGLSYLGDFDIDFSSVEIPAGTESLGGTNASSVSGFTMVYPLIRIRVGSVNYEKSFIGSVGDFVPLRITRVGTELTIYEGASSQSFALPNVVSFDFDQIGSFNGINFLSVLLKGTLTMSGSGVLTRSYSFDQPVGSSTLPDTTSGLDLTLTGFVSGGFVAGDNIIITSPDNTNIVKKMDVNGDAVFTVAGTYDLTLAPDKMEYSLDGVSWLDLDLAPAGNAFSGNATVNGQKTITVRAANSPTVTGSLSNVTSAFVIAAWGQSNEEGRVLTNQPLIITGDNPTPMMYRNGLFSPLTDPTGFGGAEDGSMWPRIVQQYSDAGVPVCISNVAIGGTGLFRWLKSAVDLYPRIQAFATATGGLSMTTAVIGEWDTANSTPQATIETQMGQIIDDLNTDYGTRHYLTYFPVGDVLAGDPSVTRAAFDNVILTNANAIYGGDLATIDIDVATAVDNDGIHIKQSADATTAANLRYTEFSSSALNITTTGVPDGTYDAVLWDESRAIAYNGAITVSSDSFSVSVVASVGAVIRGDAYDPLGADTDGFRVKGTTS